MFPATDYRFHVKSEQHKRSLDVEIYDVVRPVVVEQENDFVVVEDSEGNEGSEESFELLPHPTQTEKSPLKMALECVCPNADQISCALESSVEQSPPSDNFLIDKAEPTSSDQLNVIATTKKNEDMTKKIDSFEATTLLTASDQTASKCKFH